MLSTAQSWRPGDFSEQAHISQATLDEHAIVFTTHPKNEPQSGTQWPDDDGYWTGHGLAPARRAARRGVDEPLRTELRAEPGPPLDRSATSRTRTRTSRRSDSTRWCRPAVDVRRKRRRVRRAVVVAADALAHLRRPGDLHPRANQSFDLVADGGSDNTWITQVGDAPRSGRSPTFRDAVLGRPVQVAARPATAAGLPGGFDVAWDSPTEGTDLRHDRAADREGRRHPIDGSRYDNPWATPRSTQAIKIADPAGGVKLDFAHGRRIVTQVTGR